METKATKAAEALLKRDFYPIFDLKSQVNFPSKGYFASVPSSFLSKSQVSQVLDTTNVSAFIETHGPDLSPKEKSKWETNQSFVKGYSTEKVCYEALKEYFETKEEWILMLHGANIMNFDFNLDLRLKEKDFIIINGTKGYILLLEAKHSLQGSNRKSSIDQLKDAKTKIQNWFGADLGSSWITIGMVYSQKGNCVQDFCDDCQRFLICGQDDIKTKLDQLILELPQTEPKPQEFRIIAKYLLFFVTAGTICIGAKQRQVVLKNIDLASSPRNIDLWACFWTPDQKSILEAEDLPRVAFTSSYGTGKTLLMVEKARRLTNVIFAIHYRNVIMSSASLLKLDLEEKFGSQNVQVVFTRQLDDLLEVINEKTHVFIDELVLDDYNKHRLSQICTKAKTVWISIAGNVFEDHSSVFQELDFYLPQLKVPLRSTKRIIESAKQVGESGLSTQGFDQLMQSIGPTLMRGYKSKDMNCDLNLVNNLTEGSNVEHFAASKVSKGLDDILNKYPDLGLMVIFQHACKKDILKAYETMSRPYILGSSEQRLPDVKNVFGNWLNFARNPPDISCFSDQDIPIQQAPQMMFSKLSALMPFFGQALTSNQVQEDKIDIEASMDNFNRNAQRQREPDVLDNLFNGLGTFISKVAETNSRKRSTTQPRQQDDKDQTTELKNWIRNKNEKDLLVSEMDDIQNGFEHHTVLIIYKNGVKPKVNSMMRAIAQLILLEINDSELDLD